MFVFPFLLHSIKKIKKMSFFAFFFGFFKKIFLKPYSSTVESVEKKDLSHHTKFLIIYLLLLLIAFQFAFRLEMHFFLAQLSSFAFLLTFRVSVYLSAATA